MDFDKKSTGGSTNKIYTKQMNLDRVEKEIRLILKSMITYF